jgi:hypothetical protein
MFLKNEISTWQSDLLHEPVDAGAPELQITRTHVERDKANQHQQREEPSRNIKEQRVSSSVGHTG